MKHVIIGLISLCLGIGGLIVWFSTFGMVMRGLVPFLLLVGGFVAILSGYRRVTAASRDAVDDELDEEQDELDEDDELDDEGDDHDLEHEAEQMLAGARRRAAMN